jgi:hypothetical protein
MSAENPTTPGGSKPKSKQYEGGCHCGRIRYFSSPSFLSILQPQSTIHLTIILNSYTIKISPPLEEGPVTSCNCSICHINGYLMVYPLDTNITWHKGQNSMTSYTFGKERVAHSFCPVCGTSVGGKSTDPNFFADHRAVNVRTLKDVDVEALKLRKVDGRNRE